MTPKEKAKDLVDKFVSLDHDVFCSVNYPYSEQCALIAVKEIREAIDWHQHEYPNQKDSYWQQVEQEIQNL